MEKELVKDIISSNNIVKFKLRKNKKNVYKLYYKLPSLNIPINNEKRTSKKIALINKKYFYKEYDFNKYKSVKCEKCAIPKGLYVFEKLYDDKFNEKMFNELNNTFNNNMKDASFTYQDKKQRTFMFDNMNIFQTLSHATKLNSELGKLLHKITKDIISNLHVEKKEKKINDLLTSSKLVIARYTTKKGIYTHIDNVKRSDGLVLTLSFGSYYTYYDLVPIDNKLESIRIGIRQGEPLAMDGKSRFIYGHAIPSGLNYPPKFIRYSLVFLISRYGNVNCEFENNFFNINICEQNKYEKYK